METIDIEKLLHECNYPCISIILPARVLHELHQSVTEAESVMEKIDVPGETIERIIGMLRAVSADALNIHSCGTGIFVSPQFAGVVSFPFKVNKKICVDQSFDAEYLIKALGYRGVPAS